MADAKPRRRLIVNADDFGRSSSINRAVIDAHRRGILTTASLMVAGEAFAEAVALARENPRLGVGLHLTLCCGRSVRAPRQIPSLVNRSGDFPTSPVSAGMKYFFSARAHQDLALEIRAQIQRFLETGLILDHLNGHLHFHLHPSVFRTLSALWTEFPQIRALRLTHDPLKLDWPLGEGRYFYRLSHALIFSLLSRRARSALRQAGLAHTRAVFGLLENDRVTEDYVARLLPILPPGDSELYSHPSDDQFKHEYEALVSPRVHAILEEQKIDLIRYQDLWRNS